MEPHENRYFDAVDYTVFGLLLFASALIGVYFAYFAKKKLNSTNEYLLGGKKMAIFPISMSLIASYVSGIALLGFPSEMYTYGTQFGVLVFSEIFAAAAMSIAYIPVFYNLQITSSYEYLNKRFSSKCRTLGSIVFIFKMMLFIPIVIYVPALAFSQVSGFPLEALIPTVCIVCIFYTTLGGIKAVVWTDTLQTILMVMGVVIVAVMGTVDVGGVDVVLERSYAGQRLDFLNTSLDPTIRHTLWGVLFGRFFYQLSLITINQAMVQRCLAMSSLYKARITIGIFAFGVAILTCLCCYCGVLIYAAFADCDPIKTGIIGKADQLLPYFVMKVTGHLPALPGIFLSGVFSAALSTMSTGLNSMCGVILEDFVRPNMKTPLSESRASFYMRVITVILGTICTILAFVVNRLGGIIQVAGSIGGITGGALFGMFSLGMFFPWANATGCISGCICATLLVGWMSIGNQVSIHTRRLVFPKKPVSIDGCDNVTLSQLYSKEPWPTLESLEPPLYLYSVSYIYYTMIGALIVVIVGLLVSFITGFNDPSEMDINLFSPVIHRFLKKHPKTIDRKMVSGISPIPSQPLLLREMRPMIKPAEP